MIEFKEGDAETIDLSSSTFDAALCRFGLMFLPVLRTGLSNIYGSLVDGGRLAAAVWASPDKVPFISLALNVVIRETKSPAPPTGAPGAFRLSDEKTFANFLKESGFKDVATERMSVSFVFDSAEDYTRYVYDTASPLRAALANQSPDRSDEIMRAITESAREYAEKDTGNVKLVNEVICVVGKK